MSIHGNLSPRMDSIRRLHYSSGDGSASSDLSRAALRSQVSPFHQPQAAKNCLQPCHWGNCWSIPCRHCRFLIHRIIIRSHSRGLDTPRAMFKCMDFPWSWTPYSVTNHPPINRSISPLGKHDWSPPLIPFPISSTTLEVPLTFVASRTITTITWTATLLWHLCLMFERG